MPLKKTLNAVPENMIRNAKSKWPKILRSEIIGLSPDGSRRVVVANSDSAPLDGNASLVIRDGILYVANLGFAHARWQDADKTVVAIQGFAKPIQQQE